MKIRPGLCVFCVLISLFVGQCASAQLKQGSIVVVKIDYKYPFPMHDTLAKFWQMGDWQKAWLLHQTGTWMQKGNSDGVTEQSYTPDAAGNDTTKFKDKSHHIEYIRNLKTGEAIDIAYLRTEIVAFKRIEKINSSPDSTDQEWLTEQKTISGHRCKKMVLVNRATKIRDTVFVALDIAKIKHPMYPNLNYFPMEFTDKAATYTVLAVQQADIPDSEFTVPTGCIVFDNEKDWNNYLFKDLTIKKP